MKILIADHQTLFRDSLRSLLEAHGLEVLGEARNGREAVDLALRLKPDVVLMDLALPEMDGFAATRLIGAQRPEVKVVILTELDDDAKLFAAIRAGAQGYLLKDLESAEFLRLLHGVDRGEPALTPALARKLLQEFARPSQVPAHPPDPDALTDREREVLALLVHGVTSNRRLAEELGVSENTVKFHVRNILDKLHLHNRAQVVGYAIRHRMVATVPE
ncbi:MAG TPA: response regulator transcription factor [Thermoanaerobaculia bacterium]|jgi:DNA-binding NarL/FixJ family response regulator|nr:response regulator transcription factor [Thermoanaerobaculia bacterium]